MQRKRKNLYWVILSLLVVLGDQVAKYYVMHHLVLGEPRSVLPVLNMMLAYNKGTAFSLLSQGAHWQYYFLTGVAIAVSAMVLVWLIQLPYHQRWAACALSLILGGAIGNVWDRFLYGYVIDFIDFHIQHWHFATFNIADAAITVGAIMLIGEMLLSNVSSA